MSETDVEQSIPVSNLLDTSAECMSSVECTKAKVKDVNMSSRVNCDSTAVDNNLSERINSTTEEKGTPESITNDLNGGKKKNQLLINSNCTDNEELCNQSNDADLLSKSTNQNEVLNCPNEEPIQAVQYKVNGMQDSTSDSQIETEENDLQKDTTKSVNNSSEDKISNGDLCELKSSTESANVNDSLIQTDKKGSDPNEPGVSIHQPHKSEDLEDEPQETVEENNEKLGDVDKDVLTTVKQDSPTIDKEDENLTDNHLKQNVNDTSENDSEETSERNQSKEQTNTDESVDSDVKNEEQNTDKTDDKAEHEQGGTNDTKIAEQTPEKALPDWFKMMIGLTHGIHDGKEIKQAEDVSETIDIHGSTQAITVQTNERLFQLIMKRLNRITRRQRHLCTCAPDLSSFRVSTKRKSKKERELNHLVEDLLEPLVEIDDVNVSCEDVNAVCHAGGVPVLHIRCMSCQSLYRVVTALNSPLFKDGIIRIKDCLEEEMKDKLDIDANITPGSIQDITSHLREQGIITDSDDFVSCGVHPGKVTEVFCFQHNDICCTTCLESQHSSCEGIKHVTSEEGKRSVIIGKVKEYNVRLHIESHDEGNCDIIACCALPSGEIILADMNNKRLKKLNKDLKVIDHCDLPDCPRDICYLGNNNLAVTLFHPGIEFVDISGAMKLKNKVHLDHDCYGLTFFDNTLYITDPMTVYMYDDKGTEKGVMYKQMAGNHSFCKIASSEDGQTFYIAAREAGLVTVDRGGNRLASLRKEDLRYVSDVCVAVDGSVLTCNCRKQTVTRVDPSGKTILGRVAERSDDMYMPQSLCYDKRGSRLIVGHLHDDYISVLDFK